MKASTECSVLSPRSPAPCSSCACVSGCRHAVPDNVAATVNGRVITYADLDKQYQAQFMSSSEQPSDDQMMIQKLEVLRTLVDNEIMLQRAEKLGLMATDADVESRFAELKAPYTQEEFQKQLAARKMTVDDMKAQLKRDLSITKLLNKEITSHISISDKDVTDFYNANKSSFNFPEPQVHLAQILVSPMPDPNVRNLKNDKAQNDEQARKKMDMLRGAAEAGRGFRDAGAKFFRRSDFGAQWRRPGIRPGIGAGEGQSGIARRHSDRAARPGDAGGEDRRGLSRVQDLFASEPAGQRELTDPRVQQNIRETLINRKDQLLRAAYYEVARDEAQVVNYLAQTIAQTKDGK